jgi:hypothetical protein
MSRRIYVLAAVAALIASPASADPECFEGSCNIPERMPQPIDPPTAVQTPQAEAVPQTPADKWVETITRIRPQMVVDPAVRPPAPVEPRYSVDARPRNYERREAVRPAPRFVDESPPRAPLARAVYPVNQGPTYSGMSSPAYVVNQGPTYGVAVPAAEPEAEVVMVHPYAAPDPVWQRCQADARGRRHIKCVPASYHPYGMAGYRPMGTYRPYRAQGVVMTAPDARIITIEFED